LPQPGSAAATHPSHCGALSGKQEAAQRQLWIKWDTDVAERLGGSAAIDARMISVRRICAQ
jgi:hypothetical protein